MTKVHDILTLFSLIAVTYQDAVLEPFKVLGTPLVAKESIPAVDWAPSNFQTFEAKETVIEMDALGTHFSLGDLYDANSHQLLPGPTLWKKEDLLSKAKKRSHPFAKISLETSDSLEAKLEKLDVSASIKLSFLSNKLQLSGSAHYLNNKKRSSRVSRMRLLYEARTHWIELTTEQLLNPDPKYKKIITSWINQKKNKVGVTHVVTKILYGGKAAFIFDREVSENENNLQISGKLEVKIRGIGGSAPPATNTNSTGQRPANKSSAEAGIEANYTTKEFEENQKISCTFYGDVALTGPSPITYESAISTYKELANAITESTAIPIRVWLFPIDLLISVQSKLLDDLRKDLMRQLTQEMDSIDNSIIEVRGFLEDSRVVTGLIQLKTDMEQFLDLVQDYKRKFQSDLLHALKTKDTENSTQIEDILVYFRNLITAKRRSPFATLSLNKFLREKHREIEALTSLTGDIPMATDSGDFEEAILSTDYLYVPVIEIKLYHKTNGFLDKLYEYLKPNSGHKTTTDTKSWLECVENPKLGCSDVTVADMRFYFIFFQSFANVSYIHSSSKTKVKVIVKEEELKQNEKYEVNIHIYQGGEKEDAKIKNFKDLIKSEVFAEILSLTHPLQPEAVFYVNIDAVGMRPSQSGIFRKIMENSKRIDFRKIVTFETNSDPDQYTGLREKKNDVIYTFCPIDCTLVKKSYMTCKQKGQVEHHFNCTESPGNINRKVEIFKI